MFPPNLQGYMRAKHGNLPTRKVTKDELIAILMKEGRSKEDAEMQIKFGNDLGSNSILVGDEWLEIENQGE